MEKCKKRGRECERESAREDYAESGKRDNMRRERGKTRKRKDLGESEITGRWKLWFVLD